MEMRKNPTADSANEAIAERREALADGDADSRTDLIRFCRDHLRRGR